MLVTAPVNLIGMCYCVVSSVCLCSTDGSVGLDVEVIGLTVEITGGAGLTGAIDDPTKAGVTR